MPLFKNKGGMLSCSNYGGIKLMRHIAGEVQQKLLNRRCLQRCLHMSNSMDPRQGIINAMLALKF